MTIKAQPPICTCDLCDTQVENSSELRALQISVFPADGYTRRTSSEIALHAHYRADLCRKCIEELGMDFTAMLVDTPPPKPTPVMPKTTIRKVLDVFKTPLKTSWSRWIKFFQDKRDAKY